MDALAERIERVGDRWYGLLLLLAIPVFLAFSPLLIGGQVVAWDDGVIQTAPYLTSYSEALHSGETPLWEPNSAFGYPLFATSFGFFAPWNYLLTSVIDDPFTFTQLLPWLIFLVFSLGTFFCVKLLREFGVSFWAAYIGGIAYLAGQRFDLLLPVTANATLFLPLLFYLIWMIRKTGSWRYVAAGAATLAFGFLSVNFQEAFYSILASLCFVTFLVFYRSSERWRPTRKTFILHLAVVYIVGALIGMVQLLPSSLFASVSTRTTGVTYQEAAEDPVLPTDFLRYVIPEAGLPLGIPFGSTGSDAPFYIGVIPLFFFLIGLFEWSAINRFFKWLWLGVLSIAIVYSPLFWLMTKLPIFSNFRVPARWMILAYFATAIIVAFGVEQGVRWSATEEAQKHLSRMLKWFLGVVVTVLLGLLLLNIVFLFGQETSAFLKSFFEAHLYARYQPLGTYPVGHYFNIIDHYVTDLRKIFALNQPILQGALASFVAGAGYLWFLVSRKQPFSRRALCALALLAVAGVLLVKPFTYETMPASTLRSIPPTITFLKDHPGRVLSNAHEAYEEEVVVPQYHPTLGERFQYRAAMLVPNLNLYYGVSSALIKDGLQILPAARLLNLVALPTAPVGVPPAFPAEGKSAQETLVMRKQLLDFLGIRYILSGFPLDEKVFPKVFETTLTSKSIPVAIYENREARSILYFMDSGTFVRGSHEEVLDLYTQDFSQMLISCEDSCIPRKAKFTRGTIHSLEEKNGLLRAEVTTKAPGFLVFAESSFPGWKAFVDGKDTNIYRVNGVFMGIEVPAGSHSVSFVFSNLCATVDGLPACLGALLRR